MKKAFVIAVVLSLLGIGIVSYKISEHTVYDKNIKEFLSVSYDNYKNTNSEKEKEEIMKRVRLSCPDLDKDIIDNESLDAFYGLCKGY